MKFRTRTTIVIETEEDGGPISRELIDELSKDLLKKSEKIGNKFVKWYADGDEAITSLLDCQVSVGVTSE